MTSRPFDVGGGAGREERRAAFDEEDEVAEWDEEAMELEAMGVRYEDLVGDGVAESEKRAFEEEA